VLSPDTTN